MAKSKNRDEAQMLIKMPPRLKTWLEQLAAESFSSQNAEVVRSVQERFDRVQAEARSKEMRA